MKSSEPILFNVYLKDDSEINNVDIIAVIKSDDNKPIILLDLKK